MKKQKERNRKHFSFMNSEKLLFIQAVITVISLLVVAANAILLIVG